MLENRDLNFGIMKILFITHYQDLYGANKSLANLLIAFKEKKYNIKVLCPFKGEMTNYLNFNKISNISGKPFNGWEYKDIKDIIKFPFRFVRSLVTLLMLRRSLKKYDPDVIYSNSSVIWIGKAIAKMLGKPHVWHVREFGLKDYGLRMVGGKPLTKLLMNKSDAVISISKSIDREVLSEIRPEIKHQIYDGVIRLSNIADSPKKKLDKDNFTFCMAGLLIPTKGYDEAIQAMQIISLKYPGARLVIAGEGMYGEYYEEYLHTLTKDLNLEKQINFLGYISDIKSFYRNADCLLMCSLAEGLGRVTIEAMAQGLPVIGKDCGGTSEIITHNVNGLLYKESKEDLANQMEAMILNKNYEKMSTNAIKVVKENFAIEQYVNKMGKLLDKVKKGYEQS
jgi:glycosyltransferase involved in cell wall biosynthesis